MEYSLSITKSGVTASLKMQDKGRKSIEFNLKEAPRKNWSKGFLAPIGGGSAITFDYFPFFHMKDMNFVLRSGTELVIKIGGEPRTPAQIPIPDLPAVKDGAEINGRFSAGADETLGIVAGEYHIKRQGQVIDMEIQPLEGWQPNPGSIWVKTWAWRGVITVGADDTISLKSEWTKQ